MNQEIYKKYNAEEIIDKILESGTNYIRLTILAEKLGEEFHFKGETAKKLMRIATNAKFRVFAYFNNEPDETPIYEYFSENDKGEYEEFINNTSELSGKIQMNQENQEEGNLTIYFNENYCNHCKKVTSESMFDVDEDIFGDTQWCYDCFKPCDECGGSLADDNNNACECE